MQRWIAVLGLVAMVAVAACGDGSEADARATSGDAPGRESGGQGEPNPPGIPRFGQAAVAATGEHLLSSDNAIQAEIRLHDLDGTPTRYATPPRRVFRPDVVAAGERFLVVGPDCTDYEVEADQEPVCQPGGTAVMLYDPVSDRWDVVAEGLWEGRPQMFTEVVRADERAALLHVRWLGHGALVEVDLESGGQRELPAPGEAFATDDQEHFSVACDVRGRIAVLTARAELVGTAPVQVIVLDEEAGAWEAAVDLPIDDASLAIAEPMCTGDGFVIANPTETFVYRDSRLLVTGPVPEWSGWSAPMRNGAEFGVWMRDRLWLLGEDGTWGDSGVASTGVFASVGVGEGVAVLRQTEGEALALDVLVVP